VEDPDSTLTNVFAWLEAGSAGRLDVVWFGTKSNNLSAAEWDVYFAQSLNANSGAPVFRQQRISDHRIHGSNISEGGLTGAANRNLGDYFQIAYDPQGAAVVSFADDHNDFDGNTYVVRQLDGPGLLASANSGSGYVTRTTPTGLPPVSLALPEVVDPVHDAIAQVQPIPTDNPFDIVSIKYFADMNGPNAPYIGARMSLSGLTTAPPAGNWLMAFAANSPWAVDQLPYGVSDHGDMFYLLVSDTTGTPQISYGTAYRDSEPLAPVVFAAYAMAYNYVGVADSGGIDTTTSTAWAKIAVSKLNALIPAGHAPIAQGVWLSGLRGSAASSGRGPRDNTRGGRNNFLVNFGSITAVDPPNGTTELSVRATPNPSRGGSVVHYAIPASAAASLGIYDVQGRLVRALLAGRTAAGVHVVRWDGLNAAGATVGNGIYFVRLRAEGHEAFSRLVVIH
jgi:hypothetical protein